MEHPTRPTPRPLGPRWGALALAACLLTGGSVRAQPCEATLTEAEARYAEGAFDAVEAAVATCLGTGGATTADAVRAYRLQALAYLRLGDLPASQAEVLKLLGASPSYAPDPIQDPPDYVGLVRFVTEQIRVQEPEPPSVEPVAQRPAAPTPIYPLPPDPDEPPPDFVPVDRMAEAIERPAPEYPAAARRAGVEGRVIVRAWVDAEGTVREVQVLAGLDPLVDQAAVEAVERWTFSPALKEGRPVPVWVTVPLTFRLG